jgi:hypothetical protein
VWRQEPYSAAEIFGKRPGWTAKKWPPHFDHGSGYRIGRRPAFAIFFIGAPLSAYLALSGTPDLNRLLWLLPVATFFSIGLSSGFVLYFPELFPSRLRATGSGLAYNVGRVVSAPVPALMGALMASNQGNVALVVMVAGAIYVIGLLALVWAPETKGLPLPE